MAETLEELAQIGKTPLGENPPDPGQVHDDSPEFTQLEQEIGKLGSLQADTVIEWRNVISASSLIIREKSKDLEAATYLCRGLWERDRYAGLGVGFTILRDIIQEHWDIAYPTNRKKGKIRAGKINWLADRVGKLLARENENREKVNAPKPEEKEAAIACAVLIKDIESLLNEKLGDNAPILREVREPLHEYQQNFIYLEEQAAAEKTKQEADQKAKQEVDQKAKQEVDQKAKQEVAQQESSVVAPAAPPQQAAAPPPKLDIQQAPQSLASANDIKKAFGSCHSTLYQIAAIKRAEKLSDPLPYRILRFSAWMSIEKMPFIQNDKFVAPGPPKSKIGECASLLEQGQYAALVESVESIFANPKVPANAYWLDAHRLTATALEALGPQYSQAKQAVIDELAAFLRRFPELPDLTFNDGTAFADAQTQLWISEQVLASDSAASDSAVSPSDGAQAWMKTAKEAKQLASKGQFAEGLSLLQEGGKSAASQREQFFWLLEQARFCYDTSHVDLAVPLLEFLEEKVARFALEEWEPMLSVEVAHLLLKCHNKLFKDDAKTPEINKRLYARLCRLDVSSALALGKK
ncbi:MAG: type VI secretion system protein TssA [Pseudomonadota bacterium]